VSSGTPTSIRTSITQRLSVKGTRWPPNRHSGVVPRVYHNPTATSARASLIS